MGGGVDIAKTLRRSNIQESREGSQPLSVTQSHIKRTAATPNPSERLSPQSPTSSADAESTLDSDQTLFKKCFSPPLWSCHYRELRVQTCVSTCARRRVLAEEALLLPFFWSIPG